MRTLHRPWRLAAVVLAAAAVVIVVARGVTGAAERRFTVTGRVVDAPGDGTVTIAHADIPGLMPAMTMRFTIAGPDSTPALAPGDQLRFRLRLDDTGTRIDRVVVTGHDEVASAGVPAGERRSSRLRPGDVVPSFRLVDQLERPVTEADLRGHLTLVTFVYTRCPLPEFCPLMTQRFHDLQVAAAGDATLDATVRLLTVTLDPAFDTPRVLDAYGRARGADPARWRFVTGDPAGIDTLTRAFAVYRERNGVTLDHTLATAAIDGDGRVIEIWRGNQWRAEDVLAVLRAEVER
ncbi:MAG: SCO family protein [Vicinamibacterales bacterium]